MKILVLILASDNTSYYRDFQLCWKRYMNLYPNIDCYFYKGNPNISTPFHYNDNDNEIIIKLNDNYDTIYEKTLKVFEYFYNDLHKYDYVYRANLSSFIRFDKYLELCKSFQKTNFCSAIIGKYNNIYFPSGCGYTLSPDLVKRLVDEKPQYICMDDVSVGLALMNWKIQITPMERYDIKNNENINLLNTNIFHFRIKTNNRINDVNYYNKLIDKYY